MIRHKYESTTTGNGSFIFVSTPSGYSSDVTTVQPISLGGYSGASGIYSYVLLDGNGTDWEHGYGRYTSPVFNRDYVCESTNSGLRLNLSGTGTHVVIIEEQPLQGAIAPMRLTGSVTTSGTSSISNWSLSLQGTSIDEWPGYSGLSLPATNLDFDSVLPYARSYRITLQVTANGSEDAYGDIKLKGDGNYWDDIITGSVLVDSTDTPSVVISTPQIDIRCPFSSSTNDGIYPGYVYVSITHRGSSSCDYDAVMWVDYYI